MLTTIQKQKKLLEALHLGIGDIIEMKSLNGMLFKYQIWLSIKEQKYFLKSCYDDKARLPITYLLSHEYRLITYEYINSDTFVIEQFQNNPFKEQKYQDVANMHPKFMLYTGGRMQGKEQLYHDFTKMWNNNIPVIVDTDNIGVHIALADMSEGLQRRVKSSPKIDNVYYNTDKKTTVVNWSNGETTKVKCAPEDKFDLENGIMAAIAKYHCENKSKTLRNTIARAAKKAKDTTKKEN